MQYLCSEDSVGALAGESVSVTSVVLDGLDSVFPNSPNSSATANTVNPTTTETITRVLAVRDDDCAPAMSPAATFPFTWAAKIMATMPKGRQQKMVTRIDGIR